MSRSKSVYLSARPEKHRACTEIEAFDQGASISPRGRENLQRVDSVFARILHSVAAKIILVLAIRKFSTCNTKETHNEVLAVLNLVLAILNLVLAILNLVLASKNMIFPGHSRGKSFYLFARPEKPQGLHKDRNFLDPSMELCSKLFYSCAGRTEFKQFNSWLKIKYWQCSEYSWIFLAIPNLVLAILD